MNATVVPAGAKLMAAFARVAEAHGLDPADPYARVAAAIRADVLTRPALPEAWLALTPEQQRETLQTWRDVAEAILVGGAESEPREPIGP